MSRVDSYRAILRSSVIMGAASFLHIAAGLVRMKAAALILGPAGVGLIGLFQNLVGTAAGVAALGFGGVGTRQIAEAVATDRQGEVAAARRALWLGTLGLAFAGGLAFVLARDWIATRIVADPLRAGEIGWLAVGVGLTVVAGSQRALLNGLRRTGDLARLQVASGIVAALAGSLALALWRDGGIVVFVLSAPVASFVLGHWFVSRLGGTEPGGTPLRVLARRWSAMARLGAAFMVSGVVVALGHLAVRSLVQRDLGPDALGQFQAAWSISATYLGVVLSAMATDFYPRLTAAIGDARAASRLVNEQTEVGLLIGGPALVAMVALAPAIVPLLYSAEFGAAAAILRWQVMGDVLKIASWPLGFVIVAAGAGKTYIASEATATAVFVLGVVVALPAIGIEATGLAFLVMYAVYLPLVHRLARRRIDFVWEASVVRQAWLLLSACALVLALAAFSDRAAALWGSLIAVLLGLYAAARLATIADLGGRTGRLASRSHHLMTRMGVHGG